MPEKGQEGGQGHALEKIDEFTGTVNFPFLCK